MKQGSTNQREARVLWLPLRSNIFHLCYHLVSVNCDWKPITFSTQETTGSLGLEYLEAGEYHDTHRSDVSPFFFYLAYLALSEGLRRDNSLSKMFDFCLSVYCKKCSFLWKMVPLSSQASITEKNKTSVAFVSSHLHYHIVTPLQW